MEKKNSIFKALILMVLIAVVLTWIIPVSSFGSGSITQGDIEPVALAGIFTNFMTTALPYMGYIAIYVLCVGGFYGVLKKSQGYQVMIEQIGSKFKGKEKRFLIISVFFFALLSSLTGMHIELFAFMPLFISVILYLGFDKMSAILSTAGAVLIGMIGNTYGNYIVGNLNTALNLDYSNELITKFFLLFICAFLLVLFLLKTASLTTKEKEKAEDVFYEKVAKNKKHGTAMLIIIGLLLILMVLAMVPWHTLFGFTAFNDFHKSVMDLQLFGVKIFEVIFGALPAFGSWTLMYLSIFLIITSIVVAIVYKVSVNDTIEGFFEGAKKVALPAFVVVFANMVMILINLSSSNSINTISVTCMNFVLGFADGFNLFLSSIAAMFGTIFCPDMQYLANWYAPMFITMYGNVTLYPLVALVFQTIYGFMMFILPVSPMLILGIGYLDVKYTDWLKHIWKFLIELLIVILATLIICWVL